MERARLQRAYTKIGETMIVTTRGYVVLLLAVFVIVAAVAHFADSL